MNDTPDEPRPPGEDPGDQQDRWPYRQSDPSAPSDGVDQPPAATAQPPLEPPAEPPYDDTNPGPFGDPPPLDEDETPPRRRLLSGGRLVAASVAVVVLLGGGAALARGGGDDGDGTDGVATVDGSTGDQAQGDDDGGGNSGRPDQSEMQDAMLDYAQCMRDHGIDMPDPEFNGDGGGMVIQGGPGGGGKTAGPGFESEEFQAADEECNDVLEDIRGDMPQLSPEEQAEMQDKLVAMAQCMRDKGYDMPDPEVNGDGGVQIQMRGGGADGPQGTGSGPDEQMQQDQEECNEQAGMENGPLGRPGGPAGPDTDSSGDDADGGTT
jgi:hypothetical protein